MMHHNEILEACLADIERGVALEEVLTALPTEAADLAPLIRLAVATRSVAHPVMRPEIVMAQQARVMSAARAARAAHPVSPRPALWGWLAMPKISLSFAGALALVLVLIGIAVGVNMLLTTGQVARMAEVSGLVEVESSAGRNDWHFVSAGEALLAGQHIRTYADSTVTLSFYEGSRTLVGPDSDLVVMELDKSSGDALRVLLSQSAGMTTNVVVPLRGTGSYYNVDTPSGLVVVHGTRFEVDVIPAGEVLFAVTRGKVQVKNDLSEVILLSGQATSAYPGTNIESPGYQFTLTGTVESIDESLSTWKVNGVEFSVKPDADILGSYEIGNSVRVKGRILETGQWVADRIEPAQARVENASFTGVIDKLTAVPGTWTIGGRDVAVDGETDLAVGLAAGSPVKVSFVVQTDGKWLARNIELLDDEELRPTARPTQTYTPTATATSTAISLEAPIETATSTPTPVVSDSPLTEEIPTPTSTVVPKNEDSRCVDRTEIQPEGLRLSERYPASYDEIMDWFCKGFGFGEIDLAYGLNQGSLIPVSEIFRMRSDGMSWGDIKKVISAKIPPSPPSRNNVKPTPRPTKTSRPNK